MKLTFVAAFAVLCGLSVLAWRLQPAEARPGRAPLVWTSDDNPLRKGQIALFNANNPQLDLKLDSANSVVEKVIVQALAGVGPDVFDAGDGFQLSAFVKSGVALDLTDFLKAEGIDVARDTYLGSHAASTYEGRIYGVPTNIAADAIWFHRDIFAAEHLPEPKGPWHWADLIPLAQRLTKRDAGGKIVRYGFFIEWYNWQHFLRGFGGKVFSPDGTRCTLDSPECIAAIQLMQDLVYRYKVAPGPADEAAMATQGGWGSGNITFFGAKRGAMALGGRWWLATLRGFKDLKLGVAECPYQTVHQYRGYGRATLVNKNSKNRAAALAFMRYLASPEYNTLINDQADGVSAFQRYASGTRFLHNPAYPDEIDNQVWADAAAHAIPDDTSPFIDGAEAGRLVTFQLDLVKANQKSAATAMRDAVRAIHEAMARTLDEDPSLAERYRALTGRSRP